VTPGLPGGGIPIPEIEYFTLEIIHDDDVVCTQLVHDITFVRKGIKLGSGKYGVGVVTVLDGKPVGSGLVMLPEDGKGESKAAPAKAGPLPPGVVSSRIRFRPSCSAASPASRRCTFRPWC